MFDEEAEFQLDMVRKEAFKLFDDVSIFLKNKRLEACLWMSVMLVSKFAHMMAMKIYDLDGNGDEVQSLFFNIEKFVAFEIKKLGGKEKYDA